MPRSLNPYAPLGRMYAELARGKGFVPKDESSDSTLEAAAAGAWQELAAAWAAGFLLAQRLGKLDAFELALMDCNYYCPWAVVAFEMPGHGLLDFLRLGMNEKDSGASLYQTYFRLARRYSMSKERGAYGPDQPFLVSEACVSKARFADAVYDERVIKLAYELADLVIREPIRAQMDFGRLQNQHRLMVQAFVEEFAAIRLGAQPGSRKATGVRHLLRDTWRSLSDTQRAQIGWIAPLMTEPARKSVRETPAKISREGTGKATNKRPTNLRATDP